MAIKLDCVHAMSIYNEIYDDEKNEFYKLLINVKNKNILINNKINESEKKEKFKFIKTK